MIYAARICNELYPWEKYTLEIDTRLGLISDQATNIHEALMCCSLPLLGNLDRRNKFDALNDEFERVDFWKRRCDLS